MSISIGGRLRSLTCHLDSFSFTRLEASKPHRVECEWATAQVKDGELIDLGHLANFAASKLGKLILQWMIIDGSDKPSSLQTLMS